MKTDRLLLMASLASILLTSFHMTDDIVRGMEKGGPFDLVVIPLLGTWLYATLVLGERRSGVVMILIYSLLSLLAPYYHMKGAGLNAQVAKTGGGGYFFIWTTLSLGVTALFSVMLAARELWRMRKA